jgi:hypothetical protein
LFQDSLLGYKADKSEVTSKSPTALGNTYKGSDGIRQYVNIDNGLQPSDFTQDINENETHRGR